MSVALFTGRYPPRSTTSATISKPSEKVYRRLSTRRRNRWAGITTSLTRGSATIGQRRRLLLPHEGFFSLRLCENSSSPLISRSYSVMRNYILRCVFIQWKI